MRTFAIALSGILAGYLLAKAAGMNARPIGMASAFIVASGILSFAVAAVVRR